MGRWAIRAAINVLEQREVPKLLNAPVLSVAKDNIAAVDPSTVRAPAGWKPKQPDTAFAGVTGNKDEALKVAIHI